MKTYENWQLKKDENNILWLGFDRAGSVVNTINDKVLEELDDIIDSLQDSKDSGLIIYSLKTNGFIAGADIDHFKNLDTMSLAVDFLHKGQKIFDKLEALKLPTVAMINGFCMGGGTELVLACDYRLMIDTPQAKIGLPEVLLGIHPGWGGTVRLPKLIGGFKALSEVILSGRALHPKKALKLGMIDKVIPERQLVNAARYYIQNKPPKHKSTILEKLSNFVLSRVLLSKLMRKQLTKHINEKHYPAPYVVVNNWEHDGGQTKLSLDIEADSIGNLIVESDTSKNLVRAFFLKNKLKEFAKISNCNASHVHVIGAGVMGGDIAAWCALQGLRVTLEDQKLESIAPAIKRAHKLFKKKLRKPHLVQGAMDRLIPDVEGLGAKSADVIIEAVFEDLEVKQNIFKKIETIAKQDAIIATNTSSIPLEEIARVLENPERLVGIHFFNPVARMELVEVVKGEFTKEDILHKACSFVGQISKLPLPVKSSTGFLVNRVLMPYLMESVALLDEGVSGEVIDKSAKDFGMMMGPVELADQVGLDVCLAVAKNLTEFYGGKISPRLEEMVRDGKLGKKTNQGFYTYKKGKKTTSKNASITSNPDIAERLISKITDEAQDCLDENVVENSDLLDAAMIFGTGFAPFRGGPMYYLKHKDQSTVVNN